ncbi:MAG: ABC transporter permease subunit [Ilumatobacter sp.]|uniref:ABC transporter permease subunit n=1 Tax=Ilumatobacter sp. TaxID=1967498 RepID=UPI00391B1454
MSSASPGLGERTGTSDPVTGGLGAMPSGPRYGASRGLIVKIASLGFLNAVVLASLPRVLDKPDYPIAVAMVLATIAIDIVYLSKRRFVPGKYLLPGTLFLLVFALYPVLYLVFISTTNYGTGNNLSKNQAIERIEANSVGAAADAVRYELQILASGDDPLAGELAFLLADRDGNRFLGTADGLTTLEPGEIVEDGRRETVDGYMALNLGAANDRSAEIAEFAVPGPFGAIDNDGFTEAFAQVQTRVYDPATDTMFDSSTNQTYTIEQGYFVNDDGERLLPGWRSGVGLENYERLINDEQTRNVFVRVFIWTVLFSLFSVVLSFALGLGLAIVFNDERMRGRKIYRSLIIIPYAIPSFMTALVWKGMLNEQFGVINRWFGGLFDLIPGLDASPPWLDGQWLPYASILLVNTWLGYPYMFLVCSGALQSIPEDLTEAASVDGATGIKRFQTITFPLLLVAVAPLLVASFAFNFNNFNLIFLLTEGRPPVQGSDAGRTDILISYVYKIAFSSGGGADYGFASAVSLVIFLIVATISAFSFRFTKSFEELR